MAYLQNSLSLKTSQRQVLTPGLVQMVSVLALNKLELKEMIDAEMVENPMLEVLDEAVPQLDELAEREAAQERSAKEAEAAAERVEKDPFDEIDFGSYFQDYLDPGFRTASSNYEELDSPSFENFLSQPSTLYDHLQWQLGSLSMAEDVRAAAELVLGNLNEDGYLTVNVEELEEMLVEMLASRTARPSAAPLLRIAAQADDAPDSAPFGATPGNLPAQQASTLIGRASPERARAQRAVAEALRLVRQLDPVGVACTDLASCLLAQIRHQRAESLRSLSRQPQSEQPSRATAPPEPALAADHIQPDAQHPPQDRASAAPEPAPAAAPFAAAPTRHFAARPQAPVAKPPADAFEAAESIVSAHLPLLQRKDVREISRAARCSPEMAQAAIDLIRRLDPKPGQRYNQADTRLIEPDVAFVKRGDEYIVVMNEEDMPSLRLSHSYRKLLRKENAEKEVRDYVKERYKSAIQLMRNIEQRKNTILRTCESIIRRQREFLDRGVEHMKPMMIKEVAEEVGVHPSTISRAVSNKYVHTAQGVYELRFFFSEGVNGPEGGDMPLMVLKRKVKKLIEDEDPRKPLTDDHLVAMLREQGIAVTRRTVAKYREDLRIPSTHQRRVRA